MERGRVDVVVAVVVDSAEDGRMAATKSDSGDAKDSCFDHDDDVPEEIAASRRREERRGMKRFMIE